jgi:hypothetical protein
LFCYPKWADTQSLRVSGRLGGYETQFGAIDDWYHFKHLCDNYEESGTRQKVSDFLWATASRRVTPLLSIDEFSGFSYAR